MTDSKLLEMAAKAAGIEVWTDIDGNLYTTMQDLLETPWNPLTDDGDALRLAVHLELETYTGQVDSGKDEQYVGYSSAGQRIRYVYEPHGDDPYAATRRAIVRAAAELGKNMKEGK